MKVGGIELDPSTDSDEIVDELVIRYFDDLTRRSAVTPADIELLDSLEKRDYDLLRGD